MELFKKQIKFTLCSSASHVPGCPGISEGTVREVSILPKKKKKKKKKKNFTKKQKKKKKKKKKKNFYETYTFESNNNAFYFLWFCISILDIA